MALRNDGSMEPQGSETAYKRIPFAHLKWGHGWRASRPEVLVIELILMR